MLITDLLEHAWNWYSGVGSQQQPTVGNKNRNILGMFETMNSVQFRTLSREPEAGFMKRT